MEDLKFTFELEGRSVDFYALDQTKVGGFTYILVAEAGKKDDAECLILKDLATEDDEDSLYEIVEDDAELRAVSKVFEELLEDTNIEI